MKHYCMGSNPYPKLNSVPGQETHEPVRMHEHTTKTVCPICDRVWIPFVGFKA